MANTDQPRSFEILNFDEAMVRQFPVDASYAGKDGDVVYLDSAGRATDTASAITLGIQQGGINDVSSPGDIVDTGAEDDKISVYICPNVIFKGQISTGALADTYTTRSAAACFDIAGSAGQQYVDAAASTNNTVKVVATSYEYKDGKESEVGAYQKKIFKFNPASHYLGTIA